MKQTHNMFDMKFLLHKGDNKQADLIPIQKELTHKEIDRLLMIRFTGEKCIDEVVPQFEIGVIINNPLNIKWGELMAK